MAAANPPKAAAADGNSSADTSSSSGSSSASDLPSLQEVLAAGGDINLKGPGGFTALHVGCVGKASAAQLKYVWNTNPSGS
jgi:hypothetical protein